MTNVETMERKSSVLGIISILLSIPFFIIICLIYTTDRLDNFYQHYFIIAFPAIFLVFPALIIGFAIAALKQKKGNKLIAYIAAIVSIPVFLIAGLRSVMTFAYILIIIMSR
jgi:hypothetical protein